MYNIPLKYLSIRFKAALVSIQLILLIDFRVKGV